MATPAETGPEIPICSGVIAKSGCWEAFFKAHINDQHWLAFEIGAETHHGTLEQRAA
jgi:hypothetical protein